MDVIERIKGELGRLYEDSSYSAQTYFEAAKFSELLGRALVFIPAVVAAASSLLVSIGQTKSWGAVGAVAGAVAATASFLGAERKAASFKDSARRYTVLRQQTQLELSLLGPESDTTEAERTLRQLREEYSSVVGRDEPAPNRAFKVASSRIGGGALDYKGSAPPSKDEPPEA